MTNQFQETPKPTEPFIRIDYNHRDFDVMINLLQIAIIGGEKRIERLSLEEVINQEMINKGKETISIYQSMLKTMLDGYDKVNRGAKHYRG